MTYTADGYALSHQRGADSVITLNSQRAAILAPDQLIPETARDDLPIARAKH